MSESGLRHPIRWSKFVVGIICLLALTLVIGYVGFVSYIRAERRAPSSALLGVLPNGYRIVRDQSFPNLGSSESRSRLVVVQAPGRSLSEALLALRKSLARQDWQLTSPQGALSSDREVCLGLDEAKRYIGDDERALPQKAVVAGVLDGSVDAFIVVSLLHC